MSKPKTERKPVRKTSKPRKPRRYDYSGTFIIIKTTTAGKRLIKSRARKAGENMSDFVRGRLGLRDHV